MEEFWVKYDFGVKVEEKKTLEKMKQNRWD